MGPKEARIFLAEDEEVFAELTRGQLQESGYQVTLEANTLLQAFELIPLARANMVNLGIIDGRLSGRPGCMDGISITTGLKVVVPGIKIIAFTSYPDADFGDVLVAKSGPKIMERLIDAIRAL